MLLHNLMTKSSTSGFFASSGFFRFHSIFNRTSCSHSAPKNSDPSSTIVDPPEKQKPAPGMVKIPGRVVRQALAVPCTDCREALHRLRASMYLSACPVEVLDLTVSRADIPVSAH